MGKSFEGREDIPDIFCYRSIKAELAAARVWSDSQAPRPQDYLCFGGIEKETLIDFVKDVGVYGLCAACVL